MKRFIVIVVLAAAPVLADEVILRGGGSMTGQIVDQTADSVTVDIGYGTITAKMSNVVKIVKSTSPLQEYRERAAKIPADDTEAWRKLAQWASSNSLSTQAHEAWRHVLAVLPDDQQANTALGMVQLKGKWVTKEESYEARGYVQFEGEWMTPAEQQSMIAERQASQAKAEADRQANDAKVAQINADQQAQKAQQEADNQQGQNQVYWGWGAGPGYWANPRYPQRTYPTTLPAGVHR